MIAKRVCFSHNRFDRKKKDLNYVKVLNIRHISDILWSTSGHMLSVSQVAFCFFKDTVIQPELEGLNANEELV